MANEHYGLGSEPVAGESRSMDDISVAEFTEQMPPSPARIPEMSNRFPVPMEEYRTLEMAARQPNAPGVRALQALQDTTTVDADTAAELAGLDLPEDELTAAAPTALAPNIVA